MLHRLVALALLPACSVAYGIDRDPAVVRRDAGPPCALWPVLADAGLGVGAFAGAVAVHHYAPSKPVEGVLIATALVLATGALYGRENRRRCELKPRWCRPTGDPARHECFGSFAACTGDGQVLASCHRL